MFHLLAYVSIEFENICNIQEINNLIVKETEHPEQAVILTDAACN